MSQQNSNNNLCPSIPYFLSSYNHHFFDPDFMNLATYAHFLIESIKKAIKRQSAIFKVEQQNDYSYRICCDGSFDPLARTLDGTFNVFSLSPLISYKEHPLITQIKAVQQQYPFAFYSLNFMADYTRSVKMLYSVFLDKNTAEQRCDELNQKIVLLRYLCKRAGFEKQCVDYEAPAKMNMKLVKRQLTNIYRNYPQVFHTQLFLFANLDQNKNLDWIVSTDPIEQFIVRLQSTSLYGSIKDYLWRLDYDQNLGYFYVFDCFFDRRDMPTSPKDELIRTWHTLSGVGCCCINDGNFYFSQFLGVFNSVEILSKNIQQELLTYLLAPIELGKYLQIDNGKYKTPTFGSKEIFESKKKRKILPVTQKSHQSKNQLLLSLKQSHV